MRLGLFLLCMVIAAALAVWGCLAFVDAPQPEQLTARVSTDLVEDGNNVTERLTHSTLS